MRPVVPDFASRCSRRRGLAAIVAASAASAASAALVIAGTASAQTPATAIRLELDNDFLAVRAGGPPPDYDYTHRTIVGLAVPYAPSAIGRTLRARATCDASRPRTEACVLTALSLAQQIYTPRHDSLRAVPGDRPYAGWLSASARFQRLDESTLQSFGAGAGVVGPPALGEEVQNTVHRLLHNRLEVGWARQLPTQAGVIADYEVARAFRYGVDGAASRFVAIGGGATLGNLRRAARAGVTLHQGFGPSEPWSASAPLVSCPRRFYVTAGYTESYVEHDAFVEGVRGYAGGARLSWVDEASAGIGMRSRRFGLEYRYVSTGREYRAEPGRHAVGTLTMMVVP
ncbi:MAG TPA: lipid A deacylase LpxR family protein [Gemmatimonadaceae bacterium]|nr:lipid A deacylase LpxR family protein [Gemmatimonadaceae bacterium]